jgi:hypothetical protein
MSYRSSRHRQPATVLVRNLPSPYLVDVVTETISKADQVRFEGQGISLLGYARDFMRLDDSSLTQLDTQFDPPAVVVRGSRRRPVSDVRLRGTASRSRA